MRNATIEAEVREEAAQEMQEALKQMHTDFAKLFQDQVHSPFFAEIKLITRWKHQKTRLIVNSIFYHVQSRLRGLCDDERKRPMEIRLWNRVSNLPNNPCRSLRMRRSIMGLILSSCPRRLLLATQFKMQRMRMKMGRILLRKMRMRTMRRR
jgi:hypothetical protein